MDAQPNPDRTANRAFDAIAMEVFSNRLLSVVEEMAITMMRASFSPTIKERRDFSVGLFDGGGRLISQGSHVPLHLASLFGSTQAVLRDYPPEKMRPGDAFICNDPYLTGGTHLPDISVITPVYADGRLVAFAGNVGHHNDVGGAAPGSTSALARSLFEEGLRIPVLRIAREGEIDDGVLNLIAQNSRLPEERALDIGVQVLINGRGARAVQDIVARMGLDAMLAVIDDVIDYTEARLRRRIRALGQGPSAGPFSFTNYMEDDGLGGPPIPITVTVRVDGDTLVVDLEGTGPQVGSAINVPLNALQATVFYSVKALLDPGLMSNQGMIDPIRIHAPLGCIANPRHPAAVGARSITCQKIAGAIFGALRGAIPIERVVASGNDVLPSIGFAVTRPDTGAFVMWAETMGGGGGARHDADGMDGIHVHVTNTLNMPTEALENEAPLIVEEYCLAPDTGGAGRHRGGMGIARRVRALHDGTVFKARSDSHKMGALGIAGGLDGGTGRAVRNLGRPDAAELPSKIAGVTLRAGETACLQTPGGAGFGPPAERSLAALRTDLRDGVASRAAAERDYGADRVAAALDGLPDIPSGRPGVP